MKVTKPQAQKPRILVVEDDVDIQDLLLAVLGRHGYEVATADSGLTALASFAQSIPDLILLDMAMPDMDGLTFLERRCQFKKTKDIPVIVVSARDRNTDVMAALAAGAANYVTKPFDTARLLVCIERLLPRPATPVAGATRVSW